MSKSSSSWTTEEHRNKCVQMKKSLIYYTKVGRNMKLWGQGVQRLVSPKSKVKNGTRLRGEQDSTQSDKTVTDRYTCGPDSNSNRQTRWWLIDIGAAPKSQTQKLKLTRWMTDRYRYGPDSKTQTGRKMADRYRCDPKLTKLELTKWWSIDIGAVPKLKLTRW